MKKTRRVAAVKRILNPRDARLKATDKGKGGKGKGGKGKDKHDGGKALGRKIHKLPKAPVHMFFKHNTALGPPFRVILDTNFFNFSIRNKLDVFKSLMDCLLAKVIPHVTDCVMAELEKLGSKYRVALRIARDPRFERLPCTHKGTYADDCIVNRVQQHRCYIVATCDRDLKRRIRKIPGVPIMYISQRKYAIERFSDVGQ